jgi:hypothetical protein
MGKRRQSLHVRIPPYQCPRNVWRLAIHAHLKDAIAAQGVSYTAKDKLELIITLYMREREIRWHDVDNRLKDIMDALQGRAGGPKSQHALHPFIPNDHQIHKVTIEKRPPPPQSHGFGHLTIRKHKEHAKTVNRVSIAKFIRAIRALPSGKPQDTPGKWYKTQKEHWLGWLGAYHGPGAYGRKNKQLHDAEFAYNHIVEVKMLTWLIEAAGIAPELVRKACRSSAAATSLPQKSAAVRKHVPWHELCKALFRGCVPRQTSRSKNRKP